MIKDIHFTCKSIKVFLSKPSNPFLIMSVIVPINICSRGVSRGGGGGGGGVVEENRAGDNGCL